MHPVAHSVWTTNYWSNTSYKYDITEKEGEEIEVYENYAMYYHCPKMNAQTKFVHEHK